LRLVTRPDESGKFAFAKVPPGERRIYLQYGERQGPVQALTHGVAFEVKPGETAQVTIGADGHRVTGKMTSKGPVDWIRDVHSLRRKDPDEPRKFADQLIFWRSEAGRALDRGASPYAAVFRPDGSFYIDDVPAGEYVLMIRATDPKAGYIPSVGPALGEFRTNVVVRNEQLDLGVLVLKTKQP